MRVFVVFCLLTMLSCQSKNSAETSEAKETEPSPEMKVELVKADSLSALVKSVEGEAKVDAAKNLAGSYKKLAATSESKDDEAKYLYKQALTTQKVLGDVNEAFGIYDELATAYPDTKYGIEASFHRAMIIHQYYKDVGKAVKLFQEFIKANPDHDLTPMAQQMVFQATRSADEIYEGFKDSVEQQP